MVLSVSCEVLNYRYRTFEFSILHLAAGINSGFTGMQWLDRYDFPILNTESGTPGKAGIDGRTCFKSDDYEIYGNTSPLIATLSLTDSQLRSRYYHFSQVPLTSPL
jgi:hypothetical protein